jgi:hypothetical protein
MGVTPKGQETHGKNISVWDLVEEQQRRTGGLACRDDQRSLGGGMETAEDLGERNADPASMLSSNW